MARASRKTYFSFLPVAGEKAAFSGSMVEGEDGVGGKVLEREIVGEGGSFSPEREARRWFNARWTK